MKKRSEAEISTTWKLEDMVPDNETWEKQLKVHKRTSILTLNSMKKN